MGSVPEAIPFGIEKPIPELPEDVQDHPAAASSPRVTTSGRTTKVQLVLSCDPALRLICEAPSSVMSVPSADATEAAGPTSFLSPPKIFPAANCAIAPPID